jgi:hypothetical protein
MKQTLMLLMLTCLGLTGQAQAEPPYKKSTEFPEVKLLLPDKGYFTNESLPEKKASMLMIFNPRCEHCQQETEELIKHINEFKDIHIVMATMMPYDSMMAYREKYKLAQYPNIIVGQDIHYFLASFYRMETLPFHAFYNRKKNLISAIEGPMPVSAILEIFKKD